MPTRNITRFDTAESYYHVYTRGINKEAIFCEESDKDYLCYLFSRHLSHKQKKTKKGYAYPQYTDQVEVLSYCIMDNHVHLLLYQLQESGIKNLMQSVLSSYTAYYNRKHNRRGPLFESRYKSSLIDSDQYLEHISRYIHLNPRSWKNYKHSSYRHIINDTQPEWLRADKVLEAFSSKAEYADFVMDYEANRDILTELKHQLSDV